MKKLFYCGMIFLIFLITTSTVRAGAITTAVDGGHYIEVLWTGNNGSEAIEVDDPNGSATITLFNMYVVLVTTVPANNPTADYDIALVDDGGVDIMGGELEDRSQTAAEQAVPWIGNAYGPRKVNGALTVTITNQAVGAGTITIRIYYFK